jgi:hypothetical protein
MILNAFAAVIAGAGSTPATMTILQEATPVDVVNNSAALSSTFGAGITTGSRILMFIAVRSDIGTDEVTDVITSITMTGVTWGRVLAKGHAGYPEGVDVWSGTVTSGGATVATINHTNNAHLLIYGIELNVAGTLTGTPAELSSYTVGTSESLGTVSFGSSKTGMAFAMLQVNPWSVGTATFTPPAGFTTVGSQVTGGANDNVAWLAKTTLTGVASITGTLTCTNLGTGAYTMVLLAYTI